MREVLDFNHIDRTLGEEKINELKVLYCFYHKLWWVYKKMFKKFRRMSLLLNLSSTMIITAGAITGGVTLNPVVLGSISGLGLIIKTFGEIKDFKKRIEMCKFAYTTYQKILNDLRRGLRGGIFDESKFIEDMKQVDEFVIDLCPPICSRFEKRYERIFDINK